MSEIPSSLPFPHAPNVFRILLVDDDPVGARLLQELMKNLKRRHELHFARDGVEALDFLHRRGAYTAVPRPDLILLDINMPRLGGLETLSAIKSDPQLCVIPVIMLSTSAAPDDVWRSYSAHANCYVQKPTNLEETVQLLQAIEAFWMECVLLPTFEENRQSIDFKQQPTPQPGGLHSGPPIAPQAVEVGSRAMRISDSPEKNATPSSTSGCAEHKYLLDELGVAVRELIELHQQQFLAIIEGDAECHRFDLLIHMANEKKQLAKYAYLRHVEEHGCLKFDAIDNART